MLRNSFLKSIINEGKQTNEYKYANEDENYMLLVNRPLSEKSIMDLPSSKLDTFVDKILTNKSVSGILYSSTATSEINLLKKANEKMINSKLETKKTVYENNPNDIVINRKKKEMIEDIKLDIHHYKQNQILDLKEKKKLNVDYRKFFEKQKAKESEDYILYMNQVRVQRFEKIFASIKEKLNDNLKSGKRQGYIFDTIPFELKEVKLPEIRLNLHDVFSRLFHNEVLLDPKKAKNYDLSEKSSNLDLNAMPKKNKNNNSNEHNFVVRNVIEAANGKEFTIKITDEIFAKCFSKHSGGPEVNFHKNSMKINDSNKKTRPYFINLLEVKDEEGNTFLHSSIKENNFDLVEYIVHKKVNLKMKNNDGDTPLHLAMKKNASNEIIGLLIENGAEVDITNNKNETPYDLASPEIKKIFNLEVRLLSKNFGKNYNYK